MIEGWTLAYWCPIVQDWTDPPRPKAQALQRRRVRLHRLKDGTALCNTKRATRWFAYPDEKPTCPDCLAIESR